MHSKPADMHHTPLRVALLGAESTGKSTLAAALALHYQTVWVPEYLREFVELHHRTPQAQEQILIARTQLAREEATAALATGILFCDTTPLMTALYSEYYFAEVDAALQELAHAYDYDFTIVTAPTTPWIADGLQRESDEVRQEVHRRLLYTLDTASIPYLLVSGDTDMRLQQVCAYLPISPPHAS